jgi:predicted TIM-barrel fold metal-dependent hydrolase
MTGADLGVIIRQTAKQQNKTLMAAVKAQRDRYAGLAAKAKDKTAKDRFKQLAKDATEQGMAAAKRLQMSADNAADSYARSMRKAVEALQIAEAAQVMKAQNAEKDTAPKKAVPAKKTAKKAKKPKKR